MAEYQFRLTPDKKTVELIFSDVSAPIPNAKTLLNAFKVTEYNQFHVLEHAFAEAVDKIDKYLKGQAEPEDQQAPPSGNSEAPSEQSAQSESTDSRETSVEPEQGAGIDTDKEFIFEVAKKRPASIEVEVAESKMEASLFVVTSEGGANPYRDDLVTKLNKANVTHGILDDAIDQLANQLGKAPGGTELRAIVAKGQAPGDSDPYHFEYLVTPFEDRVLEPQLLEDGSRNMKNLGEIETVSPGTHLVKRVKGKTGASGFNVFGESISARIPEKPEFNIGEGTLVSKTDPDVLVASIDGVPMKKANGMRISDALIVRDVDLKVGNIDYKGNVLVKGNVTPGMTVKAKGDVMVDGYVESAHIMAMGDVVIKQGIIGRPVPLEFKDEEKVRKSFTVQIMAMGDISALYAQYAFLNSKRNINIGNQLLNSYSKCRGSVKVGRENDRRSRLVGGKIIAHQCVEVGVIGSNSFVPTQIDLSERYQKYRTIYKEKEAEIKAPLETKEKLELILETLSKKKESPQLREQLLKTENTLSQIEQKLTKLNKESSLAQKKLENLKEVLTVQCWASMFPGIEVHIGSHVFSVENEYKRGVVKFSNDKLVFEQN